MAIQDKVIIITGASSGIGEASALMLAKHGAKLVLGARREERLRELCNTIKTAGGTAVYQVCDVTKPEDNDALVSLAKRTYGRVDAIFLNAGLMPNSPLSALHVDEWNAMIDVNLKGVLNGIKSVIPVFKEQHSGHVLATSSVAGLKAYPGGAVYGATKWALRDLMEVLRMESGLETNRIRTTTLYPAAIRSELLDTISDADSARDMQHIYDTYQIDPERIARAVLFAIDLPEDTDVSEITIGPTDQPW